MTDEAAAETDPVAATAETSRQTTIRHSLREMRQAGARNPAWTLAVATGTIGIILLFLLQWSSRPASLSVPTAHASLLDKAEPDAVAVELGAAVSEPGWTDDVAAPFQPDPLPAFDEPEFEPEPLPEPEPRPEPVPPPVDLPPPVELAPQFDVEIGRIEPPFDPADRERNESLFFVESEDLAAPVALAPLPPLGDEPWMLRDRSRADGDAQPISYLAKLSAETLAQLREQMAAPSREPTATESLEESGISMTYELPSHGAATEPYEYAVVIRNPGDETLENIVVEEQLPPTGTVTDVRPAGLLEAGTIRWAFERLAPGQEQRLSVQIVPETDGTWRNQARVRMTAAVTGTTLVEGAKLKFEVTMPERIEVGQACPIRFKVTNVGVAAADNVVIRDDLPDALAYHAGQKLHYQVGRLEPGESREAQLTPQGTATGEAANRAELVADGKVLETSVAEVDVVPASRPQAPPAGSQRQSPGAPRMGICVPCVPW